MHVVGRVDEHTFSGGAIADGIDKVDHLTGEIVVLREITAGEQLAKVETVTAHDDEPTRAYP